MAGATRFEALIGWQKARALTREVYRITRQGAFTRDCGLAGQMQRASVRGSSHRSSLSTQHSQNVAPGPTVRAPASPKSM